MNQNEKETIVLELRRRALKLAHVQAEDSASEARQGEMLAVLPFLLGDERYGVPFEHVKLVHPLENYIPIPGTPDFILGVSSVSGSIYSVNDLKVFFNLPLTSLTNLNKLIIVEFEGLGIGILADEVYGFTHVHESDLGSKDAWPIAQKDHIKGVTEDGLIVIDLEKLLKDPAMTVDASSQTQT